MMTIQRPFIWVKNYLKEHKVFARIVAGALIVEVMFGWLYLPGHIKSIFAADDSIDATVNSTAGTHAIMSPSLVFVSDQTGYMFYRDSGGSCVYSKTTNAGAAWGAAVTVNSDTACLHIAVWYDQWTPGDNTGTNIHIVTIEATGTAASGFHDSWYSRLDTSNDNLSTIANITNQGQTPSLTATQNFPSITKATDGDLYAGVIDTTDAYVMRCTATCTTGTNWAETASNPFTSPALGNDTLTLVPLAGGNVMAIRLDVSANTVASNIYTDSGSPSWGSWTTIQTGVQIAASAQYYAVGAVVNKITNDIYLTYADLETGGTLGGNNDDIRTALYSGGSWTQTTDILTNTTRGVSGATIALDQSSGDVYVVYMGQTTAGTVTTGQVYWKKSTDKMATWGAEQGPINAAAGDMSGLFVNYMSADRIYATWEDSNGGNKIVGTTVANITPPAYTQAVYRLYDNTDGTGGTWWNSSWLQRRKITFNTSTIGSNLTDFPVRVSLSSSNIDYSKTQNAGEDLRFVDSDNSTALDYEIEKWDEAGTSEVWVRVPQLAGPSTTDSIYMYYNNVGASDGQNKNGVWNSNYKGVWHMQEPTGTTLGDSTVNANNATKVSSTNPNPTTGQVDGAQTFNGSTSQATANDSASLDITSNITMSGWVRPSAINAFQEFFTKGDSNANPVNYGFQLSNGNNLDFYISDCGGCFADLAGNTVFSTNTWYYVVATYNNSTANLYVNGSLDATGSLTSPENLTTNNGKLLIGNNANSEFWNGILDELRVSNSIRSADWVKAEYLTGTNAMNTFGSEENYAAALTPLAAANTAGQRLPSGLPFRLRLLLSVANDAVQIGLDSFKLQYAKKVGTCDTAFSGETYTDVGSGNLQFFNNPTPADGAGAGVGTTDPTDGANVINMQTYEESNNFTNITKIGTSEDGLWDFALTDTSRSSGEPYCFRVVKSDGTTINTYSMIPELTLPDVNGAMRHGEFFSGQAEQNDAW